MSGGSYLLATALAPVLDLDRTYLVEPEDTLEVKVYATKLSCKIEKKGAVDRVIVLAGGQLIPLYVGEDGS